MPFRDNDGHVATDTLLLTRMRFPQTRPETAEAGKGQSEGSAKVAGKCKAKAKAELHC